MIWNSDLNRSKAMVPSIYPTLTSIGQVKYLRALGAPFQKNRNSKLTQKHPFPGKIAAKELLKENDRIFKKKLNYRKRNMLNLIGLHRWETRKYPDIKAVMFL